MLHKIILFIFVFFIFCETSSAETIVEKKVVRISLYSVQPGWSIDHLPKLELIITDNKLQKPITNYSYGLDSDDPADIDVVDVQYSDNLFALIPQAFINDSNALFTFASQSGAYLFIVRLDDGSTNRWRIYLPNSESEQIQAFITKIDGILGHTLF